MEEKKFTLKGHSYQIADTGDYDGHWEITNGKVSLFTKDDPEDEAALKSVADSLNNSGCKFYLDDSAEIENKILQSHLSEKESEINKYKEYYKILQEHGQDIIDRKDQEISRLKDLIDKGDIAGKFAEWMSGLISANYKSGGTWYVQGKFVTTVELYSQFKKENNL